ncbi:hypothetical protein [Bradyrhizobium sp. NBAIM14]|uniref:hypothetical protein n=1 Tax=Bradyrhizobium sp. NBAIM14 TaxID=2793814 RepID=UPI001CD29492|nr:hypothetical protein [Bradyrhizobium sp. NBAIM14]MCA1495855.1 hypothetical protein [Bradyrhizobium sp. NBAIM14]
MTFFANAGVKWPSVQSQLQQAGTDALTGGAELWKLFSKIEAWKFDQATIHEDEEDVKGRCVKALRNAADTYSSNLESFETSTVDLLTPAEIEAAALPSYYDDQYPFQFVPSQFNTRELYRELITRIRTLASQVTTFNLQSDRRDLAVQVFRAMRDWETIASLARLIAVLNLRQGK